MVTGVLLSGLAWLVQRVASVTARPSAERRLAGRLAILAAPDLPSLAPPALTVPLRPKDRRPADTVRGVTGVPGARDSRDARGTRDARDTSGDPGDPDYADDLPPLRPRRDRGRTVRLVVVAVVGAALLGGLVVGLAELTQTREEHEDDSAATSVLVRIDMRGKDMTAERRTLAAHQVWERCRDSTSVPLNQATLGSLGDGLFAGVVRPALTDHDRMRLTGCLEDTALDRTHLIVVGIGDTDADDD